MFTPHTVTVAHDLAGSLGTRPGRPSLSNDRADLAVPHATPNGAAIMAV
jgi:hypothetical protein